MTVLGYALSSEEHSPIDLVRYATHAEQAGFQFAMISDHFHPWTRRQGHSPLVWSVLGGIAHATRNLSVGTGVTCPTMRYHPAIVAQAAATIGAMMPGRFWLRLGSGERLNEHILGEHWPPAPVRLEMLQDAIAAIRTLWQGGEQSYYGDYFIVEQAQIFDLPDPLPPILLAASGSQSAKLAGNAADGLISVSTDKKILEDFDQNGGKGKLHIGQIAVCWAEDEQKAREIVFEWWPTAMLPEPLGTELATPQDFESASKPFSIEDLPDTMVYGPDKYRHLEQIRKMVEAGFDHVYVHQIGPDQEGFFKFYQREILPAFQ